MISPQDWSHKIAIYFANYTPKDSNETRERIEQFVQLIQEDALKSKVQLRLVHNDNEPPSAA